MVKIYGLIRGWLLLRVATKRGTTVLKPGAFQRPGGWSFQPFCLLDTGTEQECGFASIIKVLRCVCTVLPSSMLEPFGAGLSVKRNQCMLLYVELQRLCDWESMFIKNVTYFWSAQ